MRAVAPELIRLPDGARPVREVFLTLPGLNFHPDRLEPWEALVAAHGAATVRPGLRGYGAPGDPAWRQVSAEQWLEDVSAAYLRLGERFPGAAVSLFGYSLGGVLGLLWSRRYGIPLHRALLLSPALALPTLPRLGMALLTLLPGRMAVPSWAPRHYRLHDLTSMAAYHAVRNLTVQFRRGSGGAPRCVFIAISRQDELVSATEAERYVATLRTLRPAGQDRLHWIDHRPRPGRLYHLGVDAATLGAGPWSHLRGDVEDWLTATAPG